MSKEEFTLKFFFICLPYYYFFVPEVGQVGDSLNDAINPCRPMHFGKSY